MQTVVEIPAYLKAVEASFSEAERRDIVTMIASDPEVGDVMPGTGGFRKVRVGRSGMGKRSGARVIYIVRGETMPVFLVAVFAKNEKSDLTQEERNQLRKRADDIFAVYGEKR